MCVVVVYPTSPPTVCECASVFGVWGDPPTALSGGDSCHQFTEGNTPSSLLYCSHDLEGEGSVDWFVRMVLVKVMLLIKGLINGLLLLYVVDVTSDHIEIFMIVVKLKYLSQPVTASYTNLIS